MLNRRHKGMVQTTIILILISCIGYGFYTQSLLQSKIRFLDNKILHQQSVQQALSSQMQAEYENKAKLEKALQKTKSECQKTKEEKEDFIQAMLVEHQDKNGALENSNQDLKDKNKGLSEDFTNLKIRYDKLYKDHEDMKQKYQELANSHAKEINEAQDDLQKCQAQYSSYRSELTDLQQRLQDMRMDHERLLKTFKTIPRDAVDLNHPALNDYRDSVKNYIIEHLGESRRDLYPTYEKKVRANMKNDPQNNEQHSPAHPNPPQEVKDQGHVPVDLKRKAGDQVATNLEQGKSEENDLLNPEINDNLAAKDLAAQENAHAIENPDDNRNLPVNEMNKRQNERENASPNEDHGFEARRSDDQSDHQNIGENRVVRELGHVTNEEKLNIKDKKIEEKEIIHEDMNQPDSNKDKNENERSRKDVPVDGQQQVIHNLDAGNQQESDELQMDEGDNNLDDIHHDSLEREEGDHDRQEEGDPAYHDHQEEEGDPNYRDSRDEEDDNPIHGDKEKDNVQVVLPPAVRVSDQELEVAVNPPPRQDEPQMHMNDVNQKIGVNNDEKAGYGVDKFDVEGNHEYGKELIEGGDDRNESDQERGIDFYPNEEETEEERKHREFRNFKRHVADKNFAVMNDARNAIPQGLPVGPNL